MFAAENPCPVRIEELLPFPIQIDAMVGAPVLIAKDPFAPADHDDRPDIFGAVLSKPHEFHAPGPLARDIVEAADQFGLDYRLVPSIAMQESNLCTKLPGKLKDSHNCWGYGVYAKQVTKFSNYTDAINAVTKTLATQYIAKGLETPEQIMTKYTPGSNGSWAKSVNYFMNQLSVAL